MLAEANPPNSDNNPPVVSPTSTRTYTELETTISLDNLATDAEGDPLTISVLNPVNGTVIFNPLTNKASFKPATGFSGIASFDFLASDAFGSSTPARVTVNVSDVPLLNLDFVKRNPSLNAGENTELVVIGDFADQKGVLLPDSYLTYTSINPEVAPIDAAGQVTGLTNGTSILSASRNNLQAVTAVRVGKLPAPTNDAEFNGALAEINGLNVYPKAVTMTAGMGRSLLVGIENIIKSPDLKFGSVGTRYFPGNSNLLQVNSDGIITAIEEGVTNVTVIHGAAELGDFEDYLKNNRVSVYEDNTYTDITKPFGTRMRGDYAVPTLFNGNFDAIAFRKSDHTIPGWSLFNGSSEDGSQSHLVDWLKIGVQEENTLEKGLIGSGYLDAIGYDENQPNYAMRMGLGGAKQIVHNYFVMPEWGDLRFNLHAPYRNTGKLKVWLETQPETNSQGQPIIGTGSHLLKEIDLAINPGNSLETYASDMDKVGFGRGGFETFHVDSNQLDRFRGQVAKLRFEVEGNTRVYLDDIFFKSNHLKFGNPSEARYNSEPPNFANSNTTNLLIEKPQYVVSYDRSTLNPAWISWQVNKSWLGDLDRPATIFVGDPQLPEGWPKIDTSSYKNAQGYSLGFDQGHGIPSGDRTNHKKDNFATFLGTNLIPQSVDNNRFFGNSNDPAQASAWYNVEQLVRTFAQQGQEIYVVAGSYGTDWNSQKRSNAHPDEIARGYTNSEAFQQKGINIPGWTWKTLLIMDRPGQGIPDVNQNTKVYTFLTPNKTEPFANWPLTGQPIPHPFNEIQAELGLTATLPDIQNAVEWRNPATWQLTIKQLEKLIDGRGGRKINFLSSLPDDIRTYLKDQLYPII